MNEKSCFDYFSLMISSPNPTSYPNSNLNTFIQLLFLLPWLPESSNYLNKIPSLPFTRARKESLRITLYILIVLMALYINQNKFFMQFSYDNFLMYIMTVTFTECIIKSILDTFYYKILNKIT